MIPLLIAEQVDGVWRPGIGDPTFMGWLTVVAYFAAAIACGLAARAERHLDAGGRAVHPIFWKIDDPRIAPTRGPRSPGRRAAFWWLLAVGMLLLGINKQLDLQSAITVYGRQLARDQGWYEGRRAVQQAFIAGVALLGVGVLAILSVLFRAVVVRRPLATIGLVFLYVFVTVRAASFHKVDVFLGDRLFGLKMNWILELGGIACVLASAGLLAIRRARGFGRM